MKETNNIQIKMSLKCRILSNERVSGDNGDSGDSGDIYRLAFESNELAGTAAPGQFVMIKCGGGAYLRRPFSFCDICEATGAAVIMYRLAGAGTQSLSKLAPGDELDVLGPLGKGFESLSCKAAIVGGGIGIFPLLLLARRLHEMGNAPDVYAGYHDSGSVVLESEFQSLSSGYTLVSDDGSTGVKGYVTDAFAEALANGAKYDAVYACGPVPMLSALKTICDRNSIRAQFSLEQRMGCGIGACLVCACAVKYDNAGHTGGAALPGVVKYARVCSDGPVFSSDKLVFQDAEV